ncbi:MAG: hypothetical protein ACXWCA_07860, partial [Kaistella sp.]
MISQQNRCRKQSTVYIPWWMEQRLYKYKLNFTLITYNLNKITHTYEKYEVNSGKEYIVVVIFNLFFSVKS